MNSFWGWRIYQRKKLNRSEMNEFEGGNQEKEEEENELICIVKAVF